MNDFESIDAALDRIRKDRLAQTNETPEDIEQRVFLDMHGECQDRAESAFLRGMLVGGVIALTVFTVTLKILGVF